MLAAAVHEAAGTLWGDARTALMQPAVVFAEGDRVILRCRRGTEKDLITALATITTAGDIPLSLRPVATGGTIFALKSRGAGRPHAIREEDRSLKGGEYHVYRYQGHKIDLLERGIKGQNVVFFTEKDIEEL
jgi:RNase P/RNase MRP subunit POP5